MAQKPQARAHQACRLHAVTHLPHALAPKRPGARSVAMRLPPAAAAAIRPPADLKRTFYGTAGASLTTPSPHRLFTLQGHWAGGGAMGFLESANVGGLVVFGTVSSLLAKISEHLSRVCAQDHPGGAHHMRARTHLLYPVRSHAVCAWLLRALRCIRPIQPCSCSTLFCVLSSVQRWAAHVIHHPFRCNCQTVRLKLELLSGWPSSVALP